MNEGAPQPPLPPLEPQVAPAAMPTAQPVTNPSTQDPRIGNIQNIYPEIKASAPEPASYTQASAASGELKILILGFASVLGYVPIVVYSHQLWLGEAFGLLTSLGAVYFSIRSFRSGSNLGPTAVIGIAAATLFFVIFAEYYLLKLVFNSNSLIPFYS